jgi:hypothetical protein
VEELDNFEKSDLPKGRPNTMNRGGVSMKSSRYTSCYILCSVASF